MGGIAGFTLLRESLPDPSATIRKMTERTKHRGPDDGGFRVSRTIALGQRWLKVADAAAAGEPLSCDEGRYRIVLDGAVDNAADLRSRLRERGRLFRTNLDVEVFLQQYAERGVEGLEEINGVFAVAIWDQARQELFLARDRLGVKPLYYSVAAAELVFASELKALLEHPAVERRIHLLSISKYLTYTYIPAPHTIFQDIHKLEPGYWLRFGPGGLEKHAYWDVPLEDNPVATESVDECAVELRELLRDSVAKQMRGSPRVGVFLSGGIDSSTIGALAAQLSAERVRTFSLGFEESSYDESPHARLVAQRLGAEHHHEVLSSQRAAELAPEVLGMLDEPFGDASVLATYVLARCASRFAKVVLSGDGGDELFLGYPAFQAHKAMERLSFLPPTWRDALNRWVRRMPVSHRYASLEFLLSQFLKGAGVSPEIRFFVWLGCFGNDQKRQLLTPAVREALLRENPFEDVINYVRQSRLIQDLQRLQYLCIKLYLQDGGLVKVDRASMAHGVEVRAPFLDHDFVEFAARIRPDYKLKGWTTKYVLKRAVRDLLPPGIAHRRKAGFMIPLAPWLAGPLRPLVEELCAESALRADGWFDPTYVRRLLDEHFAQRRDYRKMIWALLAFQVWRKCYGSSN